MKTKTLHIFLIFIACIQSGICADVIRENGLAYYYDFKKERITGLHEDEIEHYGIEYSINSHKFLKLLEKKDNGQQEYDHLNVRAKVLLPKQEFFIDYEGNIRAGIEYYRIDRDAFVKLLLSPRQISQ